MKLLDDDLFVEGSEDTEASNGLVEEDEDFIEKLEKKAEEVESDEENSN